MLSILFSMQSLVFGFISLNLLIDICRYCAEIPEAQRHTPTPASSSRTLDPKTASTVEKILKFGRELHALSIRLKREFGKNEANKKALRVCMQWVLLTSQILVHII